MKAKSGQKTLLASVLMSSPGPIVLGIALLYGRSATQIADFIRRTAELLSIIVSYIVFRILQRNAGYTGEEKNKLEYKANLSVGLAMCLSGLAMIFITLNSSGFERGNAIPGLIIAILGVITNSWFCLRYTRLNRQEPDSILAVQSRLYLAKSIVDTSVTITLGFIVFASTAWITKYIDLIGSILVSIYLIINGIVIIKKGRVN